MVIGAVALTIALGGSTAGAESTASWLLAVKVVSTNSNVTLSPVGELADPACPDDVCRFRYPAGTTVKLTAVAGAGSWFEGWDQLFTNRPTSCTGTSRFCTLVMDGSKYAKAIFSPLQLWPSSSVGGRIDVEGGTGCGSGCYQFRYGATATVWAVANNDYHFGGWTSKRCRSVKGAGCRFTIRDNTSVSAFFDRNDGYGQTSQPITKYVPFQARVKGTGTGTVTGPIGLNCPPKCEVKYERGRQVALTATATGGSRFIGWTGACANAYGPTCVFRSVPTSSGGGRWASAWFNRP